MFAERRWLYHTPDRLALARQPDDRERADALVFLSDAQEREGRAAAFVDFCQVLFGTNEFIFIE